jgi:predicted ATP-dependent endonuclease of OLD family
VTNIYQINNVILDSILNQNLQDLPQWQMAGLPIDPADLTLDMEGLKYSLWLDPRRCSSFFANKVLLVEGPTETALINYLEDSGYLTWRHEGLFVLDTMGKYNIHRFMNLFGALGIPHYVLYDQDNGRCQVVENTISSCSNSYTKGIDHFINDIEDFLGIQKASRQHRKPQHVLYSVKCGACSQQKLTDLAIKINDLVNA